MSPREVVVFALRGLGSNKLRTALTTLGIMIGVGSVILLVAVGNGSSQAIQSSIKSLGTNLLTVQHASSGFGPQAARSSTSTAKDLTVADARALTSDTEAPDVGSVAPVVTTSATAVYDGGSHSISSLVGTYPAYFEATNNAVRRGSYFSNADVLAGRKVVVIGSTVKEDLFGTVNPIGKKLVIGGVPFTVRGVLKSKGSSGLSDSDDVAIAPLTTVQGSLAGYGSLDSIDVQATSSSAIDAAESEITAMLDRRHKITDSSDADFTVSNQASLLSTSTKSAKTFTVLLAAVAGISLLVGGIGITNIMLVTVTERTREIGIRKAIGARRSAIIGQFLTEATLLSVLGGALGVLIGAIGSLFEIAGIRPVIVPTSILLAFGVSVAIGLFFGGYPATRAAALRPIEALRYE